MIHCAVNQCRLSADNRTHFIGPENRNTSGTGFVVQFFDSMATYLDCILTTFSFGKVLVFT